MNRLDFLKTLGLLGLSSCIYDDMDIKKLNWWIGEQVIPPAIGTIYSQSSWANLNDFTDQGSSASIVSNAIRFSGGGTFASSLAYNRYTSLEQWSYTIRFKIGTLNATSYGPGIGVRSTNTTFGAASQSNVTAKFSMTSGFADDRKLVLYGGTANATLATSSGTIATIALNDIIEMTFTRSFNTITATAYNVTTGSASISVSYTFNIGSSAVALLHNTGRFTIWKFGGTFDVTSINISSLEITRARIAVIGDSKTAGYCATVNADRFATLLKNQYLYVAINAGQSDGLAEHLIRINEIKALAPQKYLICGASNDIRAGRVIGSITSDYDSLVSQLEAIAPVYHATGFPEVVLNQTALKTHITSTYSSARIIETLTVTTNLNADNIHPSTTGHATIANTLISSNKL